MHDLDLDTFQCVKLLDCKDQRSDCYALRVLDYCRLMSEYMTEQCARTCGFCPSGGGESDGKL